MCNTHRAKAGFTSIATCTWSGVWCYV